MCPFAELYDANLHDFLSNLRRVDGSLPVHPVYGPPVNFSLLKIPANTGYMRQLLSWGIFCSWSLIGGTSFPGQVLWDADLAPHIWEDAGRTAWSQSRSVSNLCSVSHYLVPVLNPFTFLLFQVQCQRNCRHWLAKQIFILNKNIFHLIDDIITGSVLVYGIQNGVSGRKGYTHYTLYYNSDTL